MKEIRIIVSAERLEIVKELFDRLGYDFTIIIFEEEATMAVVVKNQHTSTILEELKGIGVGTIFGKVIVSPVALEIASKKKESIVRDRGISIDEMISNIKNLSLVNTTFVGLIVLAGILASFGLIYDNVVIIIASMIIAPLLGPIALTVIGTMTPKNIYSKRAIGAEIIGLFSIILIGFIVGIIYRFADPNAIVDGSNILSNQIQIRIKPTIGDIVFAIASGLAAGLFIIRGESTSIVGVAVAASLCPPAANVGVLLATPGLIGEAFGSLVLLGLNVLAIYASCALIFWTSQSFVRGGTVSTRQFKRISRKYITQIVMTFLVLATIITLIVLDNIYNFIVINV
ncbi:MAG: TIGR00341 family protein [Candidatus Heimdallarchaeota archaeon]|nr:TIGR00341 family protein [Candidatus Heimdallarchaeota archaeon]